jgi:hypothetical protein
MKLTGPQHTRMHAQAADMQRLATQVQALALLVAASSAAAGAPGAAVAPLPSAVTAAATAPPPIAAEAPGRPEPAGSPPAPPQSAGQTPSVGPQAPSAQDGSGSGSTQSDTVDAHGLVDHGGGGDTPRGGCGVPPWRSLARTLEARVAALERALLAAGDEMDGAAAGAAAAAAALPAAAMRVVAVEEQGGMAARAPEPMHRGALDALPCDVRAMVHELMALAPLLARTFEVIGGRATARWLQRLVVSKRRDACGCPSLTL